MKHDSCRNTFEFPYAGQNLGYRSRTGNTFEDLESVIENVINGWYSEIRYAEQSDIDTCCKSASGNAIGHFTMVVSDRAIQVGCAIARYSNRTDVVWRGALMACNYAFTNMVGQPIYISGPTGSGCITGMNKDHQALCSVHEPIAPLI